MNRVRLSYVGQDTVRRITQAGRTIDAVIGSAPQRSLMAFDFDGTLAEIVPEPSDARLFPGVRHLLGQLAHQLGTLAIISGRDVRVLMRLADLRSWGAGSNLVVLGQYGVERWDARSDRIQIPEAPPTVRQALGRVQQLLADVGGTGGPLAGVQVEDKGLGIGIHTRRAADPPAALERLRPELERIAGDLGLQVQVGRAVVELRAFGLTKGEALDALVRDREPHAIAMAGDDIGDLPAFEVVERWRAGGGTGATVASASDEEPRLAARADIICQGPAGVAAWLREVTAQIASARSGGSTNEHGHRAADGSHRPIERQ